MISTEQHIPKSFALFLVAILFVCLTPLIPIAPRYDTYMHPFRAEVVASVCFLFLTVWVAISDRHNFSTARLSYSAIRPVLIPLLLFISWSATSLFWAVSWRSVVHHTGLWVCYLAVFLFVHHFVNTDERLDQLSKALIILAILICSAPVFEYYSLLIAGGSPEITLRYSRYNELLITVFPILFLFTLKQNGRWLFAGFIALSLISVLVFATARRAGMGIIVFELAVCSTLFLVVKDLRSQRRKVLKLSAVITVVILMFQVLAFAFTTSTPVTTRYNDPFLAGSDGLRRVVGAVALKMGEENPVSGVGAGNYGQLYGKYPVVESVLDNDPAAAIVLEERVAERAHNEYLQIFAELGFIGLTLFLALIVGIGILIKRNIVSLTEMSPVAISALIGLGGFLASSLVSSYSFRLLQNGLVFFVVAAIGTCALKKNNDDRSIERSGLLAKFLVLVIVIGCSSLLAVSLSRIYAVHTGISAERSTDQADQAKIISHALKLDPDNASLATFVGSTLNSERKYADAAVQYRTAIDLGRTTATDYFNLSSKYYMAGNTDEAINAIKEGLIQHPRSIFLLTQLALLCEEKGSKSEVAPLLSKAREVNAEHAVVWEKYLRHGGRVASIYAHENKLPALMDLYPQSAVYAVKADRETRFPEENFETPKPAAPNK